MTCRPARWAVPSLLAVALAAAAAGCANGRVSDQDQAEAVLSTFLGQCAHERPLRALEQLTDPARRVFVGAPDTPTGCARVLRLPGGRPVPAGALRTATRDLVRFDGARATFRLRAGNASSVVALSRGTEGWRIEGPG